MRPWSRRCSCGAVYDRAGFLALPPPPKGAVQEVEGTAEWLDLRNCRCGSTMAEPGLPSAQLIVNHAAEIYAVLVDLLDDERTSEEVQRLRARASRVLRACRQTAATQPPEDGWRPGCPDCSPRR